MYKHLADSTILLIKESDNDCMVVEISRHFFFFFNKMVEQIKQYWTFTVILKLKSFSLPLVCLWIAYNSTYTLQQTDLWARSQTENILGRGDG